MGTSIQRTVYYCPKCDKTLPKENVEKIDRELRDRFGIAKLSNLNCPVCGTEYIDLDKVAKGGEKHVGKVWK
ncbi:MAG: hypothetical protein NTY62_04410 [Euryarchaeota archaeon]|nr:hypothetical protein [Euryarchaeota archaeon]